jgi:hypothetical protein
MQKWRIYENEKNSNRKRKKTGNRSVALILFKVTAGILHIDRNSSVNPGTAFV